MTHRIAQNSSATRFVWIAAGLLFFTASTGAAFAGWLNHGAEIFLVLAETGLAWCF